MIHARFFELSFAESAGSIDFRRIASLSFAKAPPVYLHSQKFDSLEL